VGGFRSRARYEQIIQKGWVKHRKYGSRSPIRMSHSVKESQDHSRSIHRRPLYTNSCFPAIFAHSNTSNVLSYIVSSSFPALNSVLASVTPLCPAQKTYSLPGFSTPTLFLLPGTKIQYLVSTLRKERLAEITTSICSIRVSLWHIAVLQRLTTVGVRSIPLTVSQVTL